jgi:hypothetical protein
MLLFPANDAIWHIHRLYHIRRRACHQVFTPFESAGRSDTFLWAD